MGAPKGKKRPGKRAKAGCSQAEAAAKRALFIEAYVANNGNATQAAIAAGYSERTARQAGSRLLTHVDVAGAVAARAQELADKYALTTDRVKKSLSQALYFDPRKLYRKDGSLKAVHELDEDTAQALAGLEVAEIGVDGAVIGYTKKLKWLDKNTAREQAMKHLGLYKADNEQKPTEARFFYVPAKGPMREAHEKTRKLAPNQRA